MDLKFKIAEIITQTHKTPFEQSDEILQLFTNNTQALQLQQTGVIKSVCDNCDQKQLYIKKKCYCGYCGDRLKT
jgi:exosome complex RNA-binding protein Csl4